MGWEVVGEKGNKAILAFNTVEVEVNAELGNKNITFKIYKKNPMKF